MKKEIGLQKNRWHVNRETGDVGLCNATIQTCPFGGDSGIEDHYATKNEALAMVEETFETLYDGNLPEAAKKILDSNRNRMIFDSNPQPEAADFTDELVLSGISAKLSGNSVHIPLLNKNVEKPGDEFGDLNATAKYIEDGRNQGKWMFSVSSPKNHYYGASRLAYGTGTQIIEKKEVVDKVKRLMKNPESFVRKLQDKDD